MTPWIRASLAFPLSLVGLALHPAGAAPAPSEHVLFAFDDRALPFQEGLKLSRLKVSVLDERFNPLPGYGPDDLDPLSSGLDRRASWKGKTTVTAPGPIRLRVDFTGVRPEDIKLYALYVGGER